MSGRLVIFLCCLGQTVVAAQDAKVSQQLEQGVAAYTQAMEADARDARVRGFASAEQLFRQIVEGDADSASNVAEWQNDWTGTDEQVARLDRILKKLSRADAFGSLNLSRRDALWESLPDQDSGALLEDAELATIDVSLPEMSPCDSVVADYNTLGL